MGKLAIMKCGDCGAIRHRIVPVDSIIRCSACRSENVIYPYDPKY
jgi:predicted Zn-ribbon and HTH transcriptional regulator